jgi:hypothetical protein
MTDKKTPEEILEASKRINNRTGFPLTTYEEDYAGGSCVYVQEGIAVDAMKEYAAQQTASLQSELDRVKEQNERLREALGNVLASIEQYGELPSNFRYQAEQALQSTPSSNGTE